MNEKILKERVFAELSRAAESFEAAQNLFEDGLFSDSVSRAYYAIYHAGRAVLLTKGLEPETHTGTVAMFGLHFVKKGDLDAKLGRIFNEAKDARELGDYMVTKRFSREETLKRVAQAKEFLAQIKAYLASAL